MKKLGILILVAMLILSSGCAKVFDTSIFYDKHDIVDGLEIATNDKAKCCFAGAYTYDGGNFDVVIPDEHNGYPITKLGGYFGRGVPTPFCINFNDAYRNFAEDEVRIVYPSKEMISDMNAQIVEINFNLYLGKNIEEIVFVTDGYYLGENNDGVLEAYHANVYVICDEENENFYSENGKLYQKDGTLIEGFAYSEKMAE